MFAFGIGTVVGLAAMLARVPIVGVFTDDPVVIGYTRSYLAMIPLTYGIVAALFVVVSSFQGLGKSWRGFAVSATRMTILVGGTLLVTRAGPSGASITGVWWTIVIANLVPFVFGYLLLRRTFRQVLAAPAPAWGGPPGKPPGSSPDGALPDGASAGTTSSSGW